MGQLSDDWEELQRVRRHESEPLAFAFVWLGSIFKAIGEHVVR